MNLTKRRKITALITLSVMLVAVVATACILTVPSLYKGEDVVPTSTANTAYGMEGVTYTTSNASAVYANLNDSSNGADIKILFPNNIYLDKSENLKDVGYYFAYDAFSRSKNGENDRLVVMDNAVGYYASGNTCNVDTTSNAYTMHRLFPNYEVSKLTNTANNNTKVTAVDTNIEAVYPTIDNLTIYIENGEYNQTNHSMKIERRCPTTGSDTNSTVKNYMIGTPDQNYDYITNNGREGTFETQTNVTLAFNVWYGTEWLSKAWRNLSNATSFSGGSGEIHYMSGFSNPTYVSNIEIGITIYDKSALNTAITNFKNNVLNNTIKSKLYTITGTNAAYDAAKAYCDKAETCLKERAVKQSDINAYTNGLNNYVFDLNPLTYQTPSAVYNGNAMTISNTWGRYDSAFYDIQITKGGASVTEIRDAGTYSLSVSPKSSVVYNGTTLRFRWADTQGNGYKSIGTYTINPATITANAQNVTRTFNNTDQTITAADVGGTVSGIIGSASATWKFSFDNSDWSDSVTLKDAVDKTVYYQVTVDDNHTTATGSITYTIRRADIAIQVAAHAGQLYGTAVPTSDWILENLVSNNMVNILDAKNITETKAYLKEIVSEFYVVHSESDYTAGTTYLKAGNYSIELVRNTQEGWWTNNIGNITFLDGGNVGAYKVNKREVTVSWTQATSLYYNGMAGKRPSASIVSKDFDDGTETGLGPVKIESGDVALVNGEAINAGTYTATVECTNANYIVDSASQICQFTILPRPLNVSFDELVRTYGDGGLTAAQIMEQYLSSCAVTLGANVSDGYGAVIGSDSMSSIFEYSISNAQYTADDRYFKANSDGNSTNYYTAQWSVKNSNYTLSDPSKNTTQIRINPASIGFTMGQILSKAYSGAEQSLALPDVSNAVINLKGYETDHRDSLKIQYSSDGVTYADDLTQKDAVNNKTVYYRISADNHTDTTGTYTATIAQANIHVDVATMWQVPYGSEIPQSADLVKNMGIQFIWVTEEFDVSDKIEFHLLDGTGSEGILTDRKDAIVGFYTVTHGFINGESSGNYNITYTQYDNGVHKNVGAYEVIKKDLYIDWAQSGTGWSEDGMHYTYDTSAPSIHPVAPDEWNGSENVVDGDKIDLEVIQLAAGVVGKYNVSTSLSKEENIRNYNIVNASADFYIVALEIQIMVKHQEATYGNAKTVRFDTHLIDPEEDGAMWAYASGSAHFFDDHYSNYRLMSVAHSAPDGEYMDVGPYPITVEPIEAATGEIVDNYKVTIVTDGDMDAIFEITPADIHYVGREFNIDLGPDSQEVGYVTIEQVIERISTTTNTPTGEFTVSMTDLFQDDLAIGDSSLNWGVSQTTTVTQSTLGSYFIWIRITHENGNGKSNFNEFTARLSVNVWTDWISVTISKGIDNAVYGDTVFTSDQLFDNLTFDSITGIVDGNGQNKPLNEALEDLKSYVELFVGSGDTATPLEGTNGFNTYSIFFSVKDGTSKDLHFRFMPYGDGKFTSNINAYQVCQREIDINWGTMDETYGYHSGTSASHRWEPLNIMPDDKDQVMLTVDYTIDPDYADNTGNIVGGHIHNAGYYIATVVGVSHPYYKLPENKVLQVKFKISPREIKISLADRSITYGVADATRDGIDAFLNRSASGNTLYTIVSGSFASGDNVASVLRLTLADYEMAGNLAYLPVKDGGYQIIGASLSPNYSITFDNAGVLTVNPATVTFDRAQIQAKTYNGLAMSVAPNIVYYTLQGDEEALKENTEISYKFFGSSNDFDKNLTVTDAGTYQILIRIAAPNHTVYETTTPINLNIRQVKVSISMTPTTKTYGDTIDDLLSADGKVADFSEWLIKHCNIVITVTDLETGELVDVTGIENDFEFKVFQSEGDEELKVGYNDVGTYRVYHVVTDKILTNYQTDYENIAGSDVKCNANAYQITPRKVSVEWEATNTVAGSNNKFEYGSVNDVLSNISAYVQLVGEESVGQGDKGTPVTIRAYIRGTDTLVNASDAGLYTAKVVSEGGFDYNRFLNNYEFTLNGFDFEIVAKKVTVTISNQQGVYGDAQTAVGAQLANKYSCDIELAGQPIVLKLQDVTVDGDYLPVNTYRIYGDCVSSNYSVTFKGEGSDKDYAIFEVVNATIDGNFPPSKDVYYNSKDYVVDVKTIIGEGNYFTPAGDMKWDDAVVLYKQANGEFAQTLPVIKGIDSAVIEYKIVLDNYNESVKSITVTVNPARLVINIVSGGASSVYGDSLLSSDDLFDKAKITLDENESSITEVDLKTILKFKAQVDGIAHVGQYNIEYEFVDSDYENMFYISLVGNNNAYEVKPREITIEWNYTQPFEYDANSHSVSASAVGAINGDVVEINGYTDNEGVNAGKYTAHVVSVNNADYTLGETSSLVWYINPKTIQVEWTAGDFTYDGDSHLVDAPVIKDGELIGDDTCDVTVEGAAVDAGKHIATATLDNSNYTIGNATYEFEIKQAEVEIAWDETSFVYNGKEQKPTASVVGGLLGDDTCNVIVAGAQINAGENYTATATLDNSNYKIVGGDSKTFAIAQRTVTLTWQEDTLTLKYSGEVQTPTAVAVDAVEGDTVEFIVSGEGLNVGNYTATVTGVKDNGNYKVESVSTSYQIIKGDNAFTSELSLPSTVGELPWSGSDKPQAKWGEVVVKYYTDAACTQEVTDISSAGEGTYWVVVSVAGTDNYDEISETFEVVLEGGLNIVIVIIGAVVSLALLIGAFVIVKSTNKKKKQQGGAI